MLMLSMLTKSLSPVFMVDTVKRNVEFAPNAPVRAILLVPVPEALLIVCTVVKFVPSAANCTRTVSLASKLDST